MAPPDNSGFAFPRPGFTIVGPKKGDRLDSLGQGGMSLRQYFAGQALVALSCIAGKDGTPYTAERIQQWADAARDLADALLRTLSPSHTSPE
jgi:hypothetical protein